MDRPAPSADVVELALPAQPEVVSVARLVAGALVAADPAFDEERGADVRLAVSEACTNAVQAQRRRIDQDPSADSGEAVTLRCAWSSGHLELTVTDHGSGFDPRDLSAHPEVTDPARLEHEGGLGIPLIRLLSDEVTFEAGPDGTTVTMTFEPRPEGTDQLIEGVRL
jgi:serine/threonine-protein kinase RsbW